MKHLWNFLIGILVGILAAIAMAVFTALDKYGLSGPWLSAVAQTDVMVLIVIVGATIGLVISLWGVLSKTAQKRGWEDAPMGVQQICPDVHSYLYVPNGMDVECPSCMLLEEMRDANKALDQILNIGSD